MSDSAINGVKPVHLELGGKTPQLVLSDCENIDNAVEKISAGIFVNSGQVCTSGTRLIAHEKVLDELLEKLINIGKSKKPGPTWEDASSLPPIVSKKQANRIESLVKNSVEMGASIIEGGSWHDTNYGGYFYQLLDSTNPK